MPHQKHAHPWSGYAREGNARKEKERREARERMAKKREEEKAMTHNGSANYAVPLPLLFRIANGMERHQQNTKCGA